MNDDAYIFNGEDRKPSSNVTSFNRYLRKIPHNIDAEMAILGGLMMNNRVYDRICDITKEEHFALIEHRSIWCALDRILSRGGAADPVTMKDWADANPNIPGFSGSEYLLRLCECACVPTSAEAYAIQLCDIYKRRQLISLNDDLVDSAYACDTHTSADDIIEDMESRLFNLAGQTQSGDFTAVDEVVGDIFAQAQEALRRGKAGMSLGVETGIRELDEKLGGLQPGDLMLLAGRTSMGKTTTAMSIAYNVAKAYKPNPEKKGEALRGGKVAFFSMETGTFSIIRQNIIARITGISGQQLRNPSNYGITEEQLDEARKKAQKELLSLPLFIMDKIHTVAGIRTALRRRIRRTGVHLAIIDYLGLIRSNNTRATLYQQVKEISQALKSLARELGIPIIALVQVNRSVEGRESKIPTNSDLRDSGHLEQDADIIMFVYREHHYLKDFKPEKMSEEEYLSRLEDTRNEIKLIIGKNRQGPLGTVKAYYNPELAVVDNLEHAKYSDAYQGYRR